MVLTLALAVGLAATPGFDNPLTRIERSLDLEFAAALPPARSARTKVRDYFPAPNEKPGWGFLPNAFPKQAMCFPAAGKEICGVADVQHHLLAFTHHGCCVQDTLMRYDGTPLGISSVDLSGVRTHAGIALGTTAAAVVRTFGAPKIYHGVGTGRIMYAYYYLSPGGCPSFEMRFVFDRAQRVDALEYGFGC